MEKKRNILIFTIAFIGLLSCFVAFAAHEHRNETKKELRDKIRRQIKEGKSDLKKFSAMISFYQEKHEGRINLYEDMKATHLVQIDRRKKDLEKYASEDKVVISNRTYSHEAVRLDIEKRLKIVESAEKNILIISPLIEELREFCDSYAKINELSQKFLGTMAADLEKSLSIANISKLKEISGEIGNLTAHTQFVCCFSSMYKNKELKLLLTLDGIYDDSLASFKARKLWDKKIKEARSKHDENSEYVEDVNKDALIKNLLDEMDAYFGDVPAELIVE